MGLIVTKAGKNKHIDEYKHFKVIWLAFLTNCHFIDYYLFHLILLAENVNSYWVIDSRRLKTHFLKILILYWCFIADCSLENSHPGDNPTVAWNENQFGFLILYGINSGFA